MNTKIVITVTMFLVFIGWSNNTFCENGKEGIMDSTEINLKKQETTTIDRLTITNNGGGHKILKNGADKSYADINLKTLNKEETHMVYESDETLWHGYLLIFKEIGWNGEYVIFTVEKVGKPKINHLKALDLAEQHLPKSTNDNIEGFQRTRFDAAISDKGRFYYVTFKQDSSTAIYIFKVDKISGVVIEK